MGSSSECYVLKWDDFHSSVANSFTDLRNEDEFLDVTLAIDQDHQMQAHKVILSASSPYFRSVLKRNPAQHPVLVMPPNVRYSDLAAIVDFIYQGEVKIPISEFQEFITLAQMLKIKGLTDDVEKASNETASNRKSEAGPGGGGKKIPAAPMPRAHRGRGQRGGHASMRGQPKRPRMSSGLGRGSGAVASASAHVQPAKDFAEEGLDVDEDEHPEVDEEGYYAQEYHPPQPGGGAAGAGVAYGDQAGPEAKPGSSSAAPGGPGIQLTGLLCPNCRMMCHGVDALKEHMSQAHGMGGPSNTGGGEEEQKQYQCHICDKNFKHAKYVQAHIKRVHKMPADGSEEPMLEGGEIQQSPGKKKGRPPKRPLMAVGDLPEQQQDYEAAATSSAGRPVGQVTPAPRGGISAEAMETSRPPLQQDRGGMVASSSGGPPPRLSHPGGRGGLKRHLMTPPGPRPRGPSGASMDIKKLGMKLGGQISISSSSSTSSASTSAGPSSSSQSPRRPMVAGSRRPMMGGAGVDPGVASGSGLASRPPAKPHHHQQHHQDPVEVKQEPMDDEFEEGEEEEDLDDYDDQEYEQFLFSFISQLFYEYNSSF